MADTALTPIFSLYHLISLPCMRHCSGSCRDILGGQKTFSLGVLLWPSRSESACQCRRYSFDPWCRKIPHATEQLSLCTTTTEPKRESPWTKTTEPCAAATEAHAPRVHVPQERMPQWESHTPQHRVASTQTTRESLCNQKRERERWKKKKRTSSSQGSCVLINTAFRVYSHTHSTQRC